jgi:hypothetical protein
VRFVGGVSVGFDALTKPTGCDESVGEVEYGSTGDVRKSDVGLSRRSSTVNISFVAEKSSARL